MGKLYIVPTPVGNMADMTPRAIEVLKGCDRIFAEDTRTSGVLLRHFGIETPCSSHHKFNEHTTVRPIIELLLAGETIALISDAGTPGVSDPGFLLTRECRRECIDVETLPGATAFVPALVNSGLPTDRFTFEGFLPPKKGRRTRLERIAANDCTSIIYESPLRLVKTLGELIEVCGADRQASVSREISKLHDTTHRGTLGELEIYFKENIPRGEIVIVLGAPEDNTPKVHKNKYKD
ncbi:16S rRNA (cytidine(1402)-2'-O)-methyltransferase [Duncaniella freteri]|uniref:16S rRNA (cytidine(1402)-2'-O)-methyltransferase n=1 Tax=Duncaniella freteri TaxID=2530391 RepID=UPI00136DC874|nr:16S rRNA (cytidine(1402)-2'-O)-methyltransferase [Duncaniella freteri]NBJ06006.1 16S rRNA (cytidine(1402)-2'-O)-methyltransferase [Alistipes sp. Z76]NCE68016.1 16S rRNA (cytidine(1402)-2'-O)-methyltransferase [Muribaculaceae bacterium M3]